MLDKENAAAIADIPAVAAAPKQVAPRPGSTEADSNRGTPQANPISRATGILGEKN